MTQNEINMLDGLIDQCAEELSNHCCNDFQVPNTAENRSLQLEIAKWSGDPDQIQEAIEDIDRGDEDSHDMLNLYDWMLLRFLCSKLMKELKPQ